MKTVRRLYFFAVAFISLEVVVWGVIGLLRSILNPDIVTDSAQRLAQAISLVLVGVPIFLFHWLWSQRAAAREEEEKSASLRAVFLYGILLATLIPVVQNLLALINRTFLSIANLLPSRAVIGGSQTWVDNIIAIVINGVVAYYFWSIIRAEWQTPHEKENFTEIRRLYRFLWVLYSLILVIFGAQQAIRYMFIIPAKLLGGIGRETAVNAIALLVVGTPIWVYTWRIVQDALAAVSHDLLSKSHAAGVRGISEAILWTNGDPAEKESNLRLGILYLLSLGGVITLLTAAGNLLYIVFNQLLGASLPWTDLYNKIGGPISIGIPFAVLWAYYGHWLNKQIEYEELEPRRAGKKRLYYYILSAIGLTASFVGTTLLLSLIIDIITGQSMLGAYGFRERLSGALATLVVGLPLWLMSWRPMQAEALNEGDAGDHARRSIIRKSYLYLVLFALVIGGMIAAVTLIFRLINAALSGSTGDNFVNSVLNSLQYLVSFVVLLLYHLSALRKDAGARLDLLEAKQSEYNVLVFDSSDGRFGDSVRGAFARQAPKVPVTVVNAFEKIPADLKASAVVLPGSLVVNTPDPVEGWMRSFSGSRLIVPDEAAGVYWLDDYGQAALSARALAEGQEVRPQSAKKTSAWTIVAYVFAALFALELLFVLLALGVRLATNF
jgi:Domain of unknown function (DUF5671)